MDTKTAGLVGLIDEAIEIANKRLKAKRSGESDVSSEEDLEAILSGLGYRRTEAVNEGFGSIEKGTSLGLVRAALEYDKPDSAWCRR